MAPRESRYRHGQNVEASCNEAMPVQQTPTSLGEAAEETSTSSRGISILKEIFPNHGSGEGKTHEGLAPAQQMLLNSIPTPSRACASPVRALTSTTPLSSPSLSPLPVLPRASCHSGEPAGNSYSELLREPAGSSYRERLRAGGREAFQRAFGIGLMPKSMKQEVMYNSDMRFARQDGAMNGHPMSQNTTPMSSPMSYSSVTDSHAVWDATAQMQSTDYWPSQMEHPLMLEQPHIMAHLAGSQPQFHQDQFQQAWSPAAMQQPELQAQPMAHPMAGAMQMPHMQLQVPQMHMQRMEPIPDAYAADSSPMELHRCMAIIMPETAQFPCDKNLVAAQLQAAADCQCYED